MARQADLPFTMVVLDQAIYAKAVDIVLQRPQEFRSVVLRSRLEVKLDDSICNVHALVHIIIDEIYYVMFLWAIETGLLSTLMRMPAGIVTNVHVQCVSVIAWSCKRIYCIQE